MVGAGAVVMHDVAPDATVAGVPARVIRAASDPARSEAFDNRGRSRSAGEPSAP
jgi:serine acetyltransferase